MAKVALEQHILLDINTGDKVFFEPDSTNCEVHEYIADEITGDVKPLSRMMAKEEARVLYAMYLAKDFVRVSTDTSFECECGKHAPMTSCCAHYESYECLSCGNQFIVK